MLITKYTELFISLSTDVISLDYYIMMYMHIFIEIGSFMAHRIYYYLAIESCFSFIRLCSFCNNNTPL